MTEKKPFFSIIVPVYNVEQYLAQCLDSLLAQTFQDLEVLVIDDRSTDLSLQIAQKYAQDHPDKIRLIPHTVNKGLGGARNTGIEAARGSYLHFLDSDDYLKPQALSVLHAALAEGNEDVLEFDFAYVDEAGNFLRQEHFARSTCAEETYGFAITHSVSACNKVFAAHLLAEHQIRFPEKRYYEDYWTVPKLLMAAQKTGLCPEALYCYRQRGSSIMHDTNIAKTKDIMDGTDSLLAFLREQGLYEQKHRELESLAIEHVLLNASLRVNGIDPRTDMQKTLRNYMHDRFPDFWNNPYMDRFTRREMRLLKLIDGGRYQAVNLLWTRRNRLTGAVKGLLYKILRK